MQSLKSLAFRAVCTSPYSYIYDPITLEFFYYFQQMLQSKSHELYSQYNHMGCRRIGWQRIKKRRIYTDFLKLMSSHMVRCFNWFRLFPPVKSVHLRYLSISSIEQYPLRFWVRDSSESDFSWINGLLFQAVPNSDFNTSHIEVKVALCLLVDKVGTRKFSSNFGLSQGTVAFIIVYGQLKDDGFVPLTPYLTDIDSVCTYTVYSRGDMCVLYPWLSDGCRDVRTGRIIESDLSIGDMFSILGNTF